MRPLRVSLIILWFLIASLGGLLMALFRWGDLDLDRDIARLISGVGLRLARLRVRYEGPAPESMQPCIYVANHQHNMDVLIFGSIYPAQTIVIGKKELIWVPVFGLAFKAAGNILLDRANRSRAMASLAQAVAVIRARRASLLVFPEGTRNRKAEGLLPFKKGAFHMAISTQLPIVPLVCSPLHGALRDLGKRDQEVVIRALPPIPTEGLALKDMEGLMERTREAMLAALRGLRSRHP
jgi:1-acyl-sn-glycerol-3-phosphate acyltransferase